VTIGYPPQLTFGRYLMSDLKRKSGKWRCNEREKQMVSILVTVVVMGDGQVCDYSCAHAGYLRTKKIECLMP
jgi:hypothetical protein